MSAAVPAEEPYPPRVGAGLLATLRAALAVWTVFGLLCAASVYWSMRDHGHSPVRLTAYTLLVWCGWAAATPIVAWLGDRRPMLPFSWRATLLHAGAAIGFGLAHHVWWVWLQAVLHPYDGMGFQRFADGVDRNVQERLFLEVAIYFAVLGVGYAVAYQRRLRDRELRAAQLEASLSQARLTALELQLQPHFLFNTLHAIGGLVRQARGPEAVAMIAGLSDLLRYALDHAGKHLVPLERELAITGRYLEIQALRFSDRLTVTVDVEADARGALVPAMMLQPLVENAIRHGVEAQDGPATIELRARRDGDRLRLEIANSGPAPADGRGGIGLANTRARLEQLYPGDHGFSLRGERGRVTARVDLPFAEAAA